ncbi:MAG: hypothetical protein EXR98_15515 [Gemmataceae bacterium]|nr:hypothetical protein [Gemmataceae bacterium]
MKRLLMFGGFVAFCLSLVGCGGDTNERLITDTIARMGLAATEVGNIKARVDDAIVKAKEGKVLDLADAIEATVKLKETGKDLQKLKQRIEELRSQVTKEDQKIFAENQKTKLNAAFRALLDNREDLRKVLLEAETYNKTEVAKLREKITDAEGPFTSLSRVN